MATLNIYKSTLASARYISKKGKECPFVNYRFLTSDKELIAELDEETTLGHPFIFVDSAEATIDSENLDPLAEIKKAAIAEYLAKQAAATDKGNDRGTTGKIKLNVATSDTVKELASNSGT